MSKFNSFRGKVVNIQTVTSGDVHLLIQETDESIISAEYLGSRSIDQLLDLVAKDVWVDVVYDNVEGEDEDDIDQIVIEEVVLS